MKLESLPNEVWILIIQKMFETEHYYDGGDPFDNRSYYFEHPVNEYTQSMYFAYYYGLLLQVSKTLNMEFKNDTYWKHLLLIDGISHREKNLMKRYISVKVVPHYKKIFLYYSGKYNDEKLTLECCNRNRDKLFSSKEIVNWENPLNTFVLIDGYWNIEVKDRISDNGKGYGKMYFQKYNMPIKKVYKWELHVSSNHRNVIERNIQYYIQNMCYYEELYNSSINV